MVSNKNTLQRVKKEEVSKYTMRCSSNKKKSSLILNTIINYVYR